MKMPSYFAATYNCNAYGAGTYSSTQACGTAPGGLANTGADFWIPLALGVALFLGGVSLLIRRMVKSHKQSKSTS
jgi:hypothetical protein